MRELFWLGFRAGFLTSGSKGENQKLGRRPIRSKAVQLPGVSVHLQEHWTNCFQILLTHEKEASDLLTD